MKPTLLPFLAWPRPDAVTWRADLVAGATVAVVAIPQALAYAQLAGVPPHLGLYAAFVPTVIAALCGSSAQLSTGPVALTALLTAASLSALAQPGTPAWVALAVVLALGSGLMQVAAGFARLGRLFEQLPASLMLGFVNAAAIVIVLSQLPAMLGIAAPGGSGGVIPALRALWAGVGGAHPATAAFGIASALALLALRRVSPRLPGALVVSLAAIAASAALGYHEGGAVVGDLPTGLPVPAVPVIDPSSAAMLLPAMALVALVSAIEVTSSARVIAARTGIAWNVNQELVGQGLAKVAAGLFGAFPVSGSFSRSALNLSAGARTAWASIVSAALVAVALLFAAHALFHLPKAVLAALIVTAVAGLLTPREFVETWRVSRADAAIAGVTLAATLLSAPRIHYGLLIGLALVGMRAVLGRVRG
ncbi:MAG: SulP family inorganic anion transporter [Burkholderiales bacterium]